MHHMFVPYHANELDELQPNGDNDSIPMVLHWAQHLVVVPEQVLDEASLIFIAQGQPSCRTAGVASVRWDREQATAPSDWGGREENALNSKLLAVG